MKTNFEKMSHTAEKKLKRGPFAIFKHPFCSKTPKKLKVGSLGNFFSKKLTMSEKPERGALQSRPVFYVTRKIRKNFFGSSWANMNNLAPAFKICRTFGRNILVTSAVSKKKLTKSHDNSRLFSW